MKLLCCYSWWNAIWSAPSSKSINKSICLLDFLFKCKFWILTQKSISCKSKKGEIILIFLKQHLVYLYNFFSIMHDICIIKEGEKKKPKINMHASSYHYSWWYIFLEIHIFLYIYCKDIQRTYDLFQNIVLVDTCHLIYFRISLNLEGWHPLFRLMLVN